MAEAVGKALEAREMRADARRNREHILLAAREVFVEQGPDAPLEEIARRAGVGIATLYRRFPDRQALMRAVALDALDHVVEEIRLAMAEEPDAFRALTRYMQRVLDLRVSAVMPALAGHISLGEEEIFSARQQSTGLIQELIERAQAAGTLRPDVTFGDISLLLIRLGRPLPSSFPSDVSNALAQRHLALLLDALRTDHNNSPEPLPGPAMTLADLRGLSPARERPADSEAPAQS
jgi:AcrR family transcriptional regulator